MSNLIKKELTLDSREVARMVEKNHSHLLRDIRTYEEYISTNPDLDSLNFFIPSIYIDSKGEERPNYQLFHICNNYLKINKKSFQNYLHSLTHCDNIKVS